MRERKQIIYSLASESDAYLFANLCKEKALEIGVSELKTSLFGSAVSEVAMNAVRYAEGSFGIIKTIEELKGVEVQVEDCGPGIKDIELAFKDGYSTYHETSLGLGLGVAKRCSDEMYVSSSDCGGTSIVLKVFIPVDEESIAVKVISHPSVNKVTNGDRYIVKTYGGDKCLVSIVTVDESYFYGESDSHVIAARISKVVEENYLCDVVEIMSKCFEKVVEASLPVEMFHIILIKVTSGEIVCSSINMPDIRFLYGNKGVESKGHYVFDSTFKFEVSTFIRSRAFILLACSPGICMPEEQGMESWDKHDLYNLAQYIFDGFSLADKDSTVVVLRGLLDE